MINTKDKKNQTDFNNYKQVRNDVTFQIRKAKNEELDKLKNKFKDPNICQKDWWKTLKYFIKPDQDSSIPPLKSIDVIYCKDEHKADKLNEFFTQQTILDEHNASLPRTRITPLYNLHSLRITSEEVKSTLLSLPTGKASGPDLISNKILK